MVRVLVNLAYVRLPARLSENFRACSAKLKIAEISSSLIELSYKFRTGRR